MFADDIALISDTVRDLQMELNLLHSYADKYNLTVNKKQLRLLCLKMEALKLGLKDDIIIILL